MAQEICRFWIALMLLAGLLPAGVAAQPARGDSLRPYPLDGVVITSTRMSTPAARVPMRTSVITQGMFAEGNGTTLGDALKFTPGVVVREYGGGGGIQTLTFRGGSSEQTLLLVDGVPVPALQTGVLDLRMFPLEEVESIEVVRGGMSSLYGANAMGGMINLKTVPLGTASYVRVRGTAGSFGTSGMAVSARIALEGVTISGGAERDRSAGDFSLRSLIGGTLLSGVRSNSDYRTDHLFLRGDWLSVNGERTSIDVSATQSDRGSPGPLVSLAGQGDGRQSDVAYRMTGVAERRFGQELEGTLTASLQRADEHYRDETGVFRGDNYYRNALVAASPLLRYTPTARWVLVSGWDLDHSMADGNALAGRVESSHAAWFASAEIRSDTTSETRPLIALSPAIRYEVFSSGAPIWNPQLGLRADLEGGAWEVTLHSSAGRSFRMPTINELHYAGAGGYGNPSLVPEVALSADAGVRVSRTLLGRAECDATFYTIQTRDRIFWQPASSPLIWSPVNIARTLARGFEIDAGWIAPSGIAELRGSYSFVDSRNRSGSPSDNPLYDRQLPYIPLETGSVIAQVRVPLSPAGVFRSLSVRLADQFLGQRYTTDDNSAYLPAEHILGGNAAMTLHLLGGSATLKYELNNITDRDVQGMPGYPMPLRHYLLSLTIQQPLGTAL